MADTQSIVRLESDSIPAFSDVRVFIVPHAVAMPGMPLDSIGYWQSSEGPTYIRVGIGSTDQQLQEIWEQRRRFPTLKLDQLRMVRNREVEEFQLC